MLHESTTPRHSVRTRTNAQTSRPGWRPRAKSPKALARDIAASIRARLAEGRGYELDDYGLGDKPDLIELVARALGVVL